jgi:hypothetical protein
MPAMSQPSLMRRLMSYISYPLTLRKMDYNAYGALAKSGNKLTSDKILQLEFNMAALKDIGVTPENMPHYDVNVRGFWQDPTAGIIGKLIYSGIALGYTRPQPHRDYVKDIGKGKLTKEQALEDYRSVYLNRGLFLNPLGQAFLTNNALNLTAGLALAAMQGLKATAKFFYGFKLLSASLLTPARKAVALYVLATPFRSLTKVMGHEHIHLLQKIDRDTGGTGLDLLDPVFRKDNRAQTKGWQKWLRNTNAVLSVYVTEYLTADYEIQARLHTLMAQGSHRWGTLPKNQTELWVALEDCGLHMPKAVRQELDGRLKDGFNSAAACHTTDTLKGKLKRFARAAFDPDVAELRAAQGSYIKTKLKNELWQFELPVLYGALLEIYGQKDGTAMMGIDKEASTLAAANANTPAAAKAAAAAMKP